MRKAQLLVLTLVSCLRFAHAASGLLDPGFGADINGISDVAVQQDGKMIIAGNFTAVENIPRSYLARLHPDGKLDQSFVPKVFRDALISRTPVTSIVLETNGNTVIGGLFGTPGQTVRANVARLNPTGDVDEGFMPIFANHPGRQADVGSLLLQSEGPIIVGGDFAEVNGVPRNSLVRLLPDGTVDPAFNAFPQPENDRIWVFATALQNDGKLLLCGRSFFSDGRYNHILKRLNTDGTTDATFKVDTDDEVELLAVQPDGHILIAGDFRTVSNISRLGLARLNPDGALDLGFNPSGDFGVTAAIAPLPQGKVLVGGDFEADDRIGGGAFEGGGLLQLNADGSLESAVDPGVLESRAFDFAMEPSGNVLFVNVKNVDPAFGSELKRLLTQSAGTPNLCCPKRINETFSFGASAIAPGLAVLEQSIDLRNWIVSKTVAVGLRTTTYIDLGSTNDSRRFYRLSSTR